MESEDLSQILEDELVQRIVRNFLDVHVLRLIQTEPMWGYKIIKRVETLFGMKIRHGSLYPLLNSLEEQGFLESKQETKQGRVRRVYEITSRGSQLIEYYYESLREQLQGLDIKREKT
jgi:PadR family transcriptional regulator PadR